MSPLARRILLTLCLLFAAAGCSLPTEPTYNADNIAGRLKQIIKDEYKYDVVTNLAGRTLWVYVPYNEEIIIEEKGKPQEFTKLFDIKSIESAYQFGAFNVTYDIRAVNETKETQKSKYNPKTFERMNKILRAIRRVFFSIKRDSLEPRFFVIIFSDTKTGLQLIDLNYVDDFRKACYELISWVEYRHRTVEDIRYQPNAIGDTRGSSIQPYDIQMPAFLAELIKQRVRVKFSQPEVKKGADIDKEVLKTVSFCLQIYKYDDYLLVDLLNSATQKRTSLSRVSLMEKMKE